MVEVEKKFALSANDEQRLTEGAEFIGERSFTDSYYDTSDFILTTNDKWLRMRDSVFELKLPYTDQHNADTRLIDQYKELTSDSEIYAVLGLPKEEGLAMDLEKNGYKPFCTFTTTRKKYKKNGFVLDFDILDFGYRIGEIEKIVEDESEVDLAIQEIHQFAKDHGLIIQPVRGKVVEYLRQNIPKHYQALIDADIISSNPGNK